MARSSRPFLNLRWKLAAALLLIVVVSVGLMAFLTNLSTTTEFQRYVEQGGMMYSQELTYNLGQFYARKQSWSGVQDVIYTIPRYTGERLVLADGSGIIVGDTQNELIGNTAKDANLSGGSPISVAGKTVGTLYIAGPRMGMGMGMGRGMMGGYGPGGGGFGTGGGFAIQAAGEEFLGRVNSYLWIAGLIAVVVALAVGILLTRQITRPIRALTVGAHNLASGNLGYRVTVKSNDELGDLAQSFNMMADSLDKSEQSRRRMVSDIAHELRTPLTIIEGTVDGFRDGVFQADSERLGNIKEQTGFLARLVNDLRDLSLAESGQMKLNLAETDIVELVKRKILQFEAVAKEKGIELKFEALSIFSAIKVDSFRIEQVISNLMTNALKHTPGGGQIEVSLKMRNIDDTQDILISVADTGEGISEEHIPHLFERFYRVEDSRSRAEGGAGLGLAIVKHLVQAHGGKVWAESEPGKGSTFYVSLPAGNIT